MMSISDWGMKFWMMISHNRLVAPIMLEGFTALSDEIKMNFLDPVSVGGTDQIEGTRQIILDGRARIRFHKRYMLISGRMENDFRFKFIEKHVAGIHRRMHFRPTTIFSIWGIVQSISDPTGRPHIRSNLE